MPRAVRREPRCAGVDGCRRGWVVATRDGVEIVERFASLIDRFDVIAVDMPIGLADAAIRGCEAVARRYISPRGSTIFSTPVRGCLTATDYRHACEISRAAIGRAISQQSWRILPKIRELDDVLTPEHDNAVVEAHPECAFATMNGGVIRAPKHTPAGLAERLVLLEPVFGSVAKALATRPKGDAKADDVLDAFAVLWTAERFARGDHHTLAAHTPERDARGLPMRIVV